MDDVLSTGGPVVVLAPHPDDESLGGGGLLADVWRRGGEAHVVCVTDGAASHPASLTHPAPALAALRRRELERAIGILGGDGSRLTWLGFPDAATHRVPRPRLTEAIGSVVDAIRPGILLAPSPLDPHCDHETTADAARELATARPGLALWFYPVWSAWNARSGPLPAPEGTRVTHRDHRNRAVKRAAIAAHRSQRGLVVHDDPEGFAMPPGFAAWFAERPETYFEALP
jgi:LmbE family N-acetylglucosaminyl deacetylase